MSNSEKHRLMSMPPEVLRHILKEEFGGLVIIDAGEASTTGNDKWAITGHDERLVAHQQLLACRALHTVGASLLYRNKFLFTTIAAQDVFHRFMTQVFRSIRFPRLKHVGYIVPVTGDLNRNIDRVLTAAQTFDDLQYLDLHFIESNAASWTRFQAGNEALLQGVTSFMNANWSNALAQVKVMNIRVSGMGPSTFRDSIFALLSSATVNGASVTVARVGYVVLDRMNRVLGRTVDQNVPGSDEDELADVVMLRGDGGATAEGANDDNDDGDDEYYDNYDNYDNSNEDNGNEDNGNEGNQDSGDEEIEETDLGEENEKEDGDEDDENDEEFGDIESDEDSEESDEGDIEETEEGSDEEEIPETDMGEDGSSGEESSVYHSCLSQPELEETEDDDGEYNPQ